MKSVQKKETGANKRQSNRYGRVHLKHSKKGIFSCLMAAGVFLLLFLLIFDAFLRRGNTTALLGSFGAFAFVLSGIGVWFGIKGFKEREKNYITCKVGIGMNVFVLLCLVAVFIRGIV